MADSKFQTLHEFMQRPFGNSSPMANDRQMAAIYQRMNSAGQITFIGCAMLESSYYLHVQIPSESQKAKGSDYKYDIVIRFFTTDPAVKKENHLRNYKIQFYSNSPSFMYQYAYVYNKKGFLIADMYGKTDIDFIKEPPKKRNPDMQINYDKSIYVVCRFLADRQFRMLEKLGILSQRRVSYQKFFNRISDFKSVKFDQALLAEERKLTKELNNKESKKKDNEDNNGKKKATTNTQKDKTKKSSITIKGKITGKKTTAKTKSISKARVIRGSRST